MYVVILVLLILMLIMYLSMSRKKCKPCQKAKSVFPRLEDATGERSMVELEADCRGTIERADFPDVVRTMWMAEKSAPGLTDRGLSSFPWDADMKEHLWNRYPIEHFGTRQNLTSATFPSKTVTFS